MPVRLYEELYYISHINNIDSIFNHGILSHFLIQQHNILRKDISDPDVQRWREQVEPIFNRRIHEYVPLYFNPLNPMLYKRRDLRAELVILAIPFKVAVSYQHIFTDGNAASHSTQFRVRSSDDFALIFNKEFDEVLRAVSWSELLDGKRRRCAEVLVYPFIPAPDIHQVYCYSTASLQVANQYFTHKAVLDPSIFF